MPMPTSENTNSSYCQNNNGIDPASGIRNTSALTAIIIIACNDRQMMNAGTIWR